LRIALSNKPTPVTNAIYEYMMRESVRETPVQKKCREETARIPEHGMQISPDEGRFLAFLVRLLSAKKTIEVGVFTGYSGLWTAGALPENGKQIACDVNVEWTKRALGYWNEAGIGNKIDLVIGKATETLKKLLEKGEAETFDFAFIDADKENSLLYYELTLQLVRRGGLIVFDNAFQDGLVAKEGASDPETDALRSLLRIAADDTRIDMSLATIADGLLLIHKL
jgi:predicted O-methyltransferase YrrM